MKSILHKVRPADVIREPFPHVVVDDALEPWLYAELASSFPPGELVMDGRPLENNTAYRLGGARILSHPALSERWKEFVRLHTSQSFFAEVLAIFGDAIRELHPTLESRLGMSLDHARTSVRGAEPFADVALDAQLCWGSPVTAVSSSAPCHVDRQVALFAGLLYCRLPHDHTPGGDLELYRFLGSDHRYDQRRWVDPSLVEPVKHIPYAANRLVFFIHSPHSLHGVTLRGLTPWPRLHVNFLAELQTEVFDLGMSA